MSHIQLQRLVTKWSAILGIRGWLISIESVPHCDLAVGRAGSYYADIAMDPQRQTAAIRVCRARDLAAAGLEPGLIEETIVHELLHLRLDPMSTLAHDAAFEVGLDCTAAALVRLCHSPRRPS